MESLYNIIFIIIGISLGFIDIIISKIIELIKTKKRGKK